MGSVRILLSSALAFALAVCAGCAPAGGGLCSAANVCPIVIYEKLPGVFAVYPDHMEATVGDSNRTLVWSFERQDLYYFDFKKGDGVSPISSTGIDHPFGSCLITDSNKDPFNPVPSAGSYFRCELTAQNTKFFTTYKIKFSSITTGKSHSVDPTVGSTGHGFILETAGNSSSTTAATPDQIIAVQLQANAPVHSVVPPEAQGQRTRVVWTAPTGSVFDPSVKEGIVFTSPSSAPSSGCTTTVDANGTTPASATGGYYVCYFPLGYGDYPVTYTANSVAGATLQSSMGNSLTR